MSKLRESEDADLFVGGVEPDASASNATERFIEEYKNRPEYHLEVEEAECILAALGINPREYGMPTAQSLLDHWRQCVADLHEPDLDEPHAENADAEKLVGSPVSPLENPD